MHCFQCPNSKAVDRQFVDMGLLPASIVKPETAFTFCVLDDFQGTNLECHMAGTSYWHKLERKTSNMFPSSVLVCCCITQDVQGLTIATRISGDDAMSKNLEADEILHMAWLHLQTCFVLPAPSWE